MVLQLPFHTLTYHPAQPQAGLTGCPHGDAGGSHVRWGLQGLDHTGWLAEGAGTNDVYLAHSKSRGEAIAKSYHKAKGNNI